MNEVPSCLLDELNSYERQMVKTWWDSLQDNDRAELTALMADNGVIPTMPIELEDESVPDDLDLDNERYEYLVNHEFRPVGIMMFERTIPLPCIALLAPLWPPYPTEVRYFPWELTNTLYAQLQSEFERQTRQLQ